MTDTIFALSSGALPAGIAVLRISGPKAGALLADLSGDLPPPRMASLRVLRDGDVMLDRALVLWLPGPATVTGEDLAELHCHGGRAVVAAVETALAATDGVRKAEAGEFTRRAFLNGRIDLAEAEGLADLLTAETELQRRGAMGSVGGSLSKEVEGWRTTILQLSAQVEAAIDFSDEDDVDTIPASVASEGAVLSAEIFAALNRPFAERLRDGVRVVLAGPPNAGKSSLFNAMLNEGAAIVSAEAGTTRDVIERPVAIRGVPFVLIDTAGLRTDSAGEIERIGIDKAQAEMQRADIILWLGAEGEGPLDALEIETKSDLNRHVKTVPAHMVSAVTGQGLENLLEGLVMRAGALLPSGDVPAYNQRQRGALMMVIAAFKDFAELNDPLLVAEELRYARRALDRLLGRESTEEMLDALFGRFCIGK
ncbi:tRNA uridine-5-carboxymethylaminomethyl(34) synthesis GTPase MnmE [Qipengyuania marisflavi]|uniref:tRNA modification GTPase MnmE n=1 Tax=Qipengyuania marisflavi TaxID=2486356 RepID=A0A5S3P583_9SPHN|nr:tRNA uridine-5-carboxymethylaminomethyl(34) synthesis GTPase MnmE [Qipengyuania marisflavi]TMM48200.1 tRNA uridine-5-carboxymethylaminomethyl(34) synthesis GTPase MnmE [Qipengyuania marisflavi]